MASRPKKRGKPTTYLQRGMSDIISYEDILVAQYMEELQRKPRALNDREVKVSPYAASLKYESQRASKRPQSAKSRQKNNKDLSDMPSWIESLPFPPEEAASEDVIEVRRLRKSRPKSAPATRERLGSFSSSLSSFSGFSGSVSSVRRSKPLYKKKAKVLCVRAFQNGNRDNFARVAAPDLLQLLDKCTEKLGLVSAARKLYLENGSLVYNANQLEKDSDVYVSCGEAFRDPYAAIRDREDLRRSASWSLSGIVLPEDKTRGKTKPSLSKRMKTLVESQKRRVLVFRNGESAEGVEIVAGRFDEFLDDCTKKLNLESGARLLFDWAGNEVNSFSEVPVLERILQPSTTVVLGPVWVTRGAERFSPKGPFSFFTTLLMNTKDRIKQSKAYKQQLDQHISDQEVMSKEIMSMKKDEAQKECKEVEEHIAELSSVMPTLKSHMKQLKDTAEEELTSSLDTYKYQHLSEIGADSRLLGKQGLRINVYENGRSDGKTLVYFNLREAEKGIQGDREQLLHRLLDACTASCQRAATTSTGPAGRRVARRLFTGDGTEIKDVHELKYDQDMWLSYGEDFKPLHVMALQLSLDKAACVSLWDEKEIVHRESLADEERGKDRASLWRAVRGFPPGTKRQLVKHDMEPAQRLRYATDLQPARVDGGSCFLQFKENRNLVLYPELRVEKKVKKGQKNLWPADAQEWIVAKSGAIHSKAFPQLVLSASEERVKAFVSGQECAGFAVRIAKRDLTDPSQQWGFSPAGHIYCPARPSLVLTCVADCRVEPQNEAGNSPSRPENAKGRRTGGGLGDLHFLDDALGESEQQENDRQEKPEPSLADLPDVYAGQTYVLALLEAFSGKHPSVGAQRWAIKQEDLSNMGQWKFSTVANPEWNKRALSWPVTEDGNWNNDFTWPMEGFLLPYSPPIKKPADKKTTPAGPPSRLKVLKNGEADQSRAVVVVGPDLTNMLRDVGGNSPNSKKNKRRAKHDHPGEERCHDDGESCHPLDLKRLEFDLFLGRCTEALSLPSAARRMFSADGQKLHSLADLARDQLVFVSCGEAWSDPKLSHSEQQRRAILTNLASDIAHIRRFCALRDPQDLVLQVDGPVAAGSRLCVAMCAVSAAEREKLVNSKMAQDADTADQHDGAQELPSHVLTAHERAHQRADERLKTLRWSWENDRTSKGDASVDDRCDGDFDNEVLFSDRALQKKFKQQTAKTHSQSRSADPCYRQKWCYTNEGFILAKGTSLALALENSFIEGKSSSEVVLCKKKVEDPTQRWVIAEDGTICSRSNPQLVLTITTPSLGNDPFSSEAQPDGGFVGSAVIVAHRKACANGNAHQLWRFNSMTGFIEGFAASTANREITAANKANVCTYAVLGPRAVQQPGYVYMPNTSKEKYLCEACGKTARGRHKLQRLQKLKTFACALGRDSDGAMKMTGSFKCLNNKVDLSTLEAEATLDLWEQQLARLRGEGSARTITRELHMAQSVTAVRIRAYKNGDGLLGDGLVLVGSSIRSLLDQCTVRLGLASAARRMYTVCGELITDVHQLVRPYRHSLAADDEDGQETGQAEELVERVNTQLQINDQPSGLSNGHAVDLVAAENRRFYKPHRQDQNHPGKEDTKLDLSGLFRRDDKAKEEEEDEDEEDGQEMRDEEEEDDDSGQETYRVSEGRNRAVPVIATSSSSGLPRWDVRWPIDVWISCGEPFVPLKEAEKQYLLSIKHREERTWVQAYLEQEKHVLRQMQGRRISGKSPQPSPREKVTLTAAWTEPTRGEEKKEETISELKNHLKDVKSKQKTEEPTLTRSAKASTQRLYSTPKTVRVRVYPNGETREREVVVFGSSIEEILNACTYRLGLSSAGRRLFTTEGDEVCDMGFIKRDQVLCVSCGEGFMRARDRRHQMELKATWSRMTRQSGGAVLPGSGPVTRDSINFDSSVLALPAPASPPPPPRALPSPSKSRGAHPSGWR